MGLGRGVRLQPDPLFSCRLHAGRETLNPLVDLGGRQRAERQAQEPLAAAVPGKNARPSARLSPRVAACARTAVVVTPSGKRQRNEESAVGTRGDRVGHVLVEAGEAGVEPRRVERLAAVRSAAAAARGGTIRT